MLPGSFSVDVSNTFQGRIFIADVDLEKQVMLLPSLGNTPLVPLMSWKRSFGGKTRGGGLEICPSPCSAHHLHSSEIISLIALTCVGPSRPLVIVSASYCHKVTHFLQSDLLLCPWPSAHELRPLLLLALIFWRTLAVEVLLECFSLLIPGPSLLKSEQAFSLFSIHLLLRWHLCRQKLPLLPALPSCQGLIKFFT